jgi:RimJ/RimL family protein N-acetyltransferase
MRIAYGGLGVAEVNNLPGCSQVAVLHSAFIITKNRGEGYGSAAHKARLDQVFNELLYDMAICTVDEENSREIAILEEEGWTQVTVFVSRKTQHAVGLWIKAASSDTPINKTYDDYVEEMESNNGTN